ncbi:MAG: ABC transporter ATP-binding protein [Methanospirillum sp.]|uniref:ABC transporter ATP-binding protein n=1 Tax=Methanospirillum sp. TaxID=45200 RepID=UPI002369D15B|nr:ABC transporter ATP-binding protein [Methanospirillum sp.]MDD1729394.1 ABC transporter ATP-binding protein [Methanospirillum sp.]
MPGIIEAVQLRKAYGSLTAVDGISFSVQVGELFGFLGPNGAGKTTTMRMCECLSPRSSGSLQIFSLDPDMSGREIRSRLGVVPQETNLDDELTVTENLQIYASFFEIPSEEARSRTEELLEFFELTSKRDTLIEQLSGGMKRRLLLARAMINRPEILILDEPTIGLDPQARHHIWERLLHIRSQGNTIVLTTHYLDEAARLCDRLVIMDHGTILVEGSPRELVDTHIGMDIVEVDQTPAVLACLQSQYIPYESGGETIQIRTKTPREIADLLLTECPGVRVITRPATLEDVFLMLTGRRLRE